MYWSLPAVGRFTSDYGPRVTNIPGASTFHRGIDIAPPIRGQLAPVSVFSIGAGVVVLDTYNSVRGNYVRIRHTDGSHTQYQHLKNSTVYLGQYVSRGQIIGIMGDSGVSSSTHLHFETYNPGSLTSSSIYATDPEPFMLKRGINIRNGVIVLSESGSASPAPTPAPEDDMNDEERAVLDTVAQKVEYIMTKLERLDPKIVHFRTSDNGWGWWRPEAGTWAVTHDEALWNKHVNILQIRGWYGTLAVSDWQNFALTSSNVVASPGALGERVSWDLSAV